MAKPPLRTIFTVCALVPGRRETKMTLKGFYASMVIVVRQC